MKAKDKLRVTWCKKEGTILFHYPMGSQTKSDAGFLSGYITEELAKALDERGYDKETLKFSIEPKKCKGGGK
jgi:hypothetical protein